MTEKKTGGSAFPVLSRGNNGLELSSAGLSARDYFAAHALQGMLCNGFMPNSIRPSGLAVQNYDYVAAAYVLADQMLEARK